VASLLPLFPLEVVLFPGTPLPLHIFEPRYKEMIGECRSTHSVFGIVRAIKDGVAEIGCSAEIVAVTKEYSDGRLDIVTEGRRRFEVMQLNRDRAFLRAEVIFLEDKPGSAENQEIARAIEMHAEIMNLAGAVQDLSTAGEVNLSFRLAGSLPLDLDFKQQLLDLASERERITLLVSYFEAVLPNLRRAAHAREKAGGNGHAR
jgi:Lon protease-like protein